MSTVAVYSYTHSVVYVADNILKSLKDVIVLSGLNPQKLLGNWNTLLSGIKCWIESQELKSVSLEIYDPATDALVTRWDITVSYSWDLNAGTFWTDTEQLKYHIRKAGLAPAQASYRVIVDAGPNSSHVDGWSDATYRSTAGMVRQSLGTTVEHNGLGASASYWRRL